ncbi:MAG: PBP1A family penicillin-binding protein [Rhodospirillum sp.]|nr:PBP1A family penicillin-binding protein [Rhodospirillum sp.]MCF8487938.1 PBP1A family penicillin-binding protein [Rhodospirillum sp.]MCF8499285.1 PBP1A family penicillin-binding protein [Rhodospirillum sp.]
MAAKPKPKARELTRGGSRSSTPPPSRPRPGSGAGGSRGRGKGQRFRRSRRSPWAVLRLFLVVVIWVGLLGTAVLVYFAHDLPDPIASAKVTRRPAITLLASDGSVLAAHGDLQGDSIMAHQAPPFLIQAILATEDRRFFSHFGIDLIGILRAAWVNLQAGRVVQGGSTLTQQVAKNLFLTNDRTVKRKVQELLLSLWLEKIFTKDQILSLYLNRVYLGAGTYGVDAASRRYFDRPVTDISLYQAALLAGLPKAPSRLNPVSSPARAQVRAREVLQNMVEAGMLSSGEAETAARNADAAIPGAARGGRGGYFADWVLDQVDDFVGTQDRDLVVRTTLDPVQQRNAEAALTSVLMEKGQSRGALQGALVAMDFRGAVRAMVGGLDHGKSPFNRAAQARRQPGSAFKPFIFLAGLEAGLTPDSILEDAPITVEGWTPSNYADSHRGPVSLTEALALSLNTVAVRVSESAGRSSVVQVARRLGVIGNLSPSPSIALGVFEVSPLDLTAAYVPFANGGFAMLPHGIVSITDGEGRVLYQREAGGVRQVMSPEHARQMDRMLGAVVAWGTGKAAALADRDARGKTGTSQDYRDAWFVGYAGRTLAGVWVGNDKNQPMDRVTGGSLPAEIWKAFMAGAP